MIYIDELTQEQIISHAEQCFPEECCGFLIDGYGYYPCDNIDENPEQAFKIKENAIYEAYELGNVEAIVHSHTNGSDQLSDADLYYKEQTDCSWILCVLDSDGHFIKFVEEEV